MTQSYADPSTDPSLSRFPHELIQGLHLARYRRSQIERGRSIIADGQSVSAVYLISEGWAVSKMSIETGDTQILDILGPGSIAGISRLGDSDAHDYSAIALQDVQAYRIETSALLDLCSRNEDLSTWLTETLSRQNQRTQQHLTALGQLPARGRLAFAMLRILEIAEQTGQPSINKTIRLPMTQEEIGNMLGLTNVSISKLMSAFRKEDLIDYGRNRIVIQDVEALSKICGMSMFDATAQSEKTDYQAPLNDLAAQSGR